MLHKKTWLKIFHTLVLIEIILLLSTKLIAEISETDLKNILASKDLLSKNKAYIISFIRANQDRGFDPNQGMVLMNCELTCIPEGLFAMKIIYDYEHPPVYARPGTKDYRHTDYDNQGNLIVWKSLEKYILFTPNRNETLTRIQSFYIDPNNQILDKGGIQTIVYRYPTGERKYTYEFNQFALSIGYDFSRYVRTINSVKSLSSGVTRVSSKGSFGKGVNGIWELTIDPNSDFLVRQATLTINGQLEPLIEVTSSEMVEKDGFKLAKYGTFTYSNLLKIWIKVTGITEVVGKNEIYEEVISKLNEPLPTGSEIMDLRDEKPIITNVGN